MSVCIFEDSRVNKVVKSSPDDGCTKRDKLLCRNMHSLHGTQPRDWDHRNPLEPMSCRDTRVWYGMRVLSANVVNLEVRGGEDEELPVLAKTFPKKHPEALQLVPRESTASITRDR
ncbi:hypothetical protein FPOAC1_011388 [Fusarium poae]|uniref:hypothetical protein n=1 Tax=Fusarium poae TaxID=36050 RepID=UPI001CE90750|nr:hypothetical protein FPOAC1_011388 [Fusarium poae]KAG8666578.1 hypothetical protein FPOAC1_011388 [Fusarium poae]